MESSLFTILFGASLGIIAFIIVFIKEFGRIRDFDEEGGAATGIGFITFIISMAIMACFTPSKSAYDSNQVEYHIIYPVSLTATSETTGRFILGCGYIENQRYYFTYYETVYGLSTFKIKDDNTYIKETDDRRPQIIGIKRVYEPIRFLGVDLRPNEKVLRKIIYCPLNTVRREFNL